MDAHALVDTELLSDLLEKEFSGADSAFVSLPVDAAANSEGQILLNSGESATTPTASVGTAEVAAEDEMMRLMKPAVMSDVKDSTLTADYDRYFLPAGL